MEKKRQARNMKKLRKPWNASSTQKLLPEKPISNTRSVPGCRWLCRFPCGWSGEHRLGGQDQVASPDKGSPDAVVLASYGNK